MPTKDKLTTLAVKRSSKAKAKAKESTTKKSTVKKESPQKVVEAVQEKEPLTTEPDIEKTDEQPTEAKEQPAEAGAVDKQPQKLVLKFKSKSALKSLVADFLLGDDSESQSLQLNKNPLVLEIYETFPLLLCHDGFTFI